MSESSVNNEPPSADDQEYSCVGADECTAVGELRNESDGQAAQDIHGQGAVGKRDALAKGLHQAADHVSEDRADEPACPD